MGLPFPIWMGLSSFDKIASNPGKRDALKTAIRGLLHYDEDVLELLNSGKDLKALRKLLKDKTKHLVE